MLLVVEVLDLRDEVVDIEKALKDPEETEKMTLYNKVLTKVSKREQLSRSLEA